MLSSNTAMLKIFAFISVSQLGLHPLAPKKMTKTRSLQEVMVIIAVKVPIHILASLDIVQPAHVKHTQIEISKKENNGLRMSQQRNKLSLLSLPGLLSFQKMFNGEPKVTGSHPWQGFWEMTSNMDPI